MDPERKLVDEGDIQYELTDEMATKELDSERNCTDSGTIMLPVTPAAVQPIFSTEKSGTGREVGNAHKAEEGNITDPPSSDHLLLVTNSSQANESVRAADVIEDKSNEKGTDDPQNSDYENGPDMEVIFLQTVNVSETVPAITIKGDEKEIESVKPTSAQETVQEPSTTKKESWDLNVLLVRGLVSGQCGNLKQLLNTTLGIGSHKIEPRQKGDKVFRVKFKLKDEMEVARVLLDKQTVLGKKVTAVVENEQPQKRKVEKVDEVQKPPAKKLKQAPTPEQIAYFNQIVKKNKDIHSKLRLLARRLSDIYPVYEGLIRRREPSNSGLMCTLCKFKVCPSKERFTNRCKFSISIDAVTGQFKVSESAANGSVNQVTSASLFPPHVVEAAKVFENAIRVCEQAFEHPEGRCQYQFWHELIIRTNVAHDLMMLVHVICPEDVADDKMMRLNKELKEFFENGEGRQCGVTSLYTRVTFTSAQSPEQRSLVLGSPYLEETVLGLKVQLPPTVHFWGNTHGAVMMCKCLEELLSPTKETSVVEVGLGIGLFGLYLSKFGGEVLSVVAQQPVAEARKNAECNNIKNIKYFGGSPLEALPQIAQKITQEKACAVVICNAIRSSAGAATMEALRKVNKVQRLVLVTGMSKNCFKHIAALCNPRQEGGLGNPFFPLRITPVDTMRNEEGYILLILMARIGLHGLPKSQEYPKSVSMAQSADKGLNVCKAGGPFIPLAQEAKGRGSGKVTVGFQRKGREFPGEKKGFKERQREERLRSLRSFGRHGLEAPAADKHYLMEGTYPSGHMSRFVEEYHLRDLMDQEWRREVQEEHRLLEDECARWIEEERRRRWVEAGQQRRQVDREEHRTWIQKRDSRMYMGESELKRDAYERELHEWVKEVRDRKFMEMNQNTRSRNSLVQELVSESLRETEISHLSAEASRKLRQLVSEAVRTVGEMDREERHGASASSGVDGISPEGPIGSRFGRSDQAAPQSRYFGDGYSRHVREVDSRSVHRYDIYGRRMEESESKKAPQSRHLDEGYYRSVMEVDDHNQRGYSVYEEGVRRDSNQHNLKPQQSIYGTSQVSALHADIDRAGSQPLRFGAPFGRSSNDVSSDDLYVRHVYLTDFSTGGNQEQKFGMLPGSYTTGNNSAAHHSRYDQPSSHSVRQSFHTAAVEQNEANYVELQKQNWNSSSVGTDYIPLSSTMKRSSYSTPKQPGFKDIHHADRNKYVGSESDPRINRFGAMQHRN